MNQGKHNHINWFSASIRKYSNKDYHWWHEPSIQYTDTRHMFSRLKIPNNSDSGWGFCSGISTKLKSVARWHGTATSFEPLIDNNGCLWNRKAISQHVTVICPPPFINIINEFYNQENLQCLLEFYDKFLHNLMELKNVKTSDSWITHQLHIVENFQSFPSFKGIIHGIGHFWVSWSWVQLVLREINLHGKRDQSEVELSSVTMVPTTFWPVGRDGGYSNIVKIGWQQLSISVHRSLSKKELWKEDQNKCQK